MKKVLWGALLSIFCLTIFMGAGDVYAAPAKSHVCDVEFVAKKVKDSNWVILDGRSGQEYLDGHIPGAVNYGKPVVTVLKHPADGRVVPVPEAEKLLGQIGLDNKKGLIIYGTKGDYHVAIEQFPIYLGVQEFYFLDGGYEAWADAGKDIQLDKVTPKPAVFKANIQKKDLYVSTDELIDIVKSRPNSVVLIDTRSKKEFDGEENSVLRQGHIPGALWIDVTENIDKASGKMKPVAELQKIYKDVPKDKKVILYCHRGCRTAYTFYALEQLGYKDVAIYEDSYIVWGGREDTPVANEHYMNLRGTVKNAGMVPELLQRLEAVEKAMRAGRQGQPAAAQPGPPTPTTVTMSGGC